jgi:outer membrane immunogenic protein
MAGLGAAQAHAQDADPWSGAYVGGSAGYGWGQSASSWKNAGAGFPDWQPDGDIAYASPAGGLYGGYLFQQGVVVAGVEADISAARYVGDDSAFAGRVNEIEMNVVGSLRGRLGYAHDNFLLYGTGGVAVTELDKRDVGFGTSDPKLASGWIAGLGVEVALDEHWRGRLEYLHAGFGGVETPILNDDGLGYFHRADAPSLNIVRVGISYGF